MSPATPNVARIVLTLLGFILIGPLIGFAQFAALASMLRLLHLGYALPIGMAILSLGPAAIFVIYLLGAPPALAAAIAYLATKRLAVAIRTGAAVLVGATATAAFSGLLADGIGGYPGPLTILLAIVGAGSAAVCTMLAEIASVRRSPGN